MSVPVTERLLGFITLMTGGVASAKPASSFVSIGEAGGSHSSLSTTSSSSTSSSRMLLNRRDFTRRLETDAKNKRALGRHIQRFCALALDELPTTGPHSPPGIYRRIVQHFTEKLLASSSWSLPTAGDEGEGGDRGEGGEGDAVPAPQNTASSGGGSGGGSAAPPLFPLAEAAVARVPARDARAALPACLEDYIATYIHDSVCSGTASLVVADRRLWSRCRALRGRLEARNLELPASFSCGGVIDVTTTEKPLPTGMQTASSSSSASSLSSSAGESAVGLPENSLRIGGISTGDKEYHLPSKASSKQSVGLSLVEKASWQLVASELQEITSTPSPMEKARALSSFCGHIAQLISLTRDAETLAAAAEGKKASKTKSAMTRTDSIHSGPVDFVAAAAAAAVGGPQGAAGVHAKDAETALSHGGESSSSTHVDGVPTESSGQVKEAVYTPNANSASSPSSSSSSSPPTLTADPESSTRHPTPSHAPADDLLPALAFTLVHFCPPNFASSLSFLENYLSEEALRGEVGYFITLATSAASFLTDVLTGASLVGPLTGGATTPEEWSYELAAAEERASLEEWQTRIKYPILLPTDEPTTAAAARGEETHPHGNTSIPSTPMTPFLTASQRQGRFEDTTPSSSSSNAASLGILARQLQLDEADGSAPAPARSIEGITPSISNSAGASSPPPSSSSSSSSAAAISPLQPTFSSYPLRKVPLKRLAAALIPPVIAISESQLPEAIEIWLEDRCCMMELAQAPTENLTIANIARIQEEYTNLAESAVSLGNLLREVGRLDIAGLE